ncbi:hypothetical protein C4D60_Mb05t29180 [Musa balbisiana]|uniref:Uncharacterized protein n=1 Tax=Musa balbisiana TaxID=52838 RepID=A0A4S8JZS9_MUSBA|nr:hypothetical protein C4D60_Mb05t29180 [Musa balbisiana]
MPGQSPEAMHIRGQQFAHHRDNCSPMIIQQHFLLLPLSRQAFILLIRRKTLRPARSKSSSLPPSDHHRRAFTCSKDIRQLQTSLLASRSVLPPSLPLQLLPECTAISAENGRVEKAVCSWQAVACADKLRYLVVALSLCSYAD